MKQDVSASEDTSVVEKKTTEVVVEKTEETTPATEETPVEAPKAETPVPVD